MYRIVESSYHTHETDVALCVHYMSTKHFLNEIEKRERSQCLPHEMKNFRAVLHLGITDGVIPSGLCFAICQLHFSIMLFSSSPSARSFSG